MWLALIGILSMGIGIHQKLVPCQVYQARLDFGTLSLFYLGDRDCKNRTHQATVARGSSFSLIRKCCIQDLTHSNQSAPPCHESQSINLHRPLSTPHISLPFTILIATLKRTYDNRIWRLPLRHRTPIAKIRRIRDLIVPFFGFDAEPHDLADVEVECACVAVVPDPDLFGVVAGGSMGKYSA